MPKSILGETAVQEIRSAVEGLSGRALKAEVVHLANHFNCSVSRVYEVTADIRPRRKVRSDRGKRAADLVAHPGLNFAARLVTLHNFDPDLAIETVRLNNYDVPVSAATLRRYLRERGLDRRARARNVQPHRRFRAAAPGEIYQFDISGVKERWFDLRTRRLLYVPETEVSANHPNSKPDRVKLWKFTLVDDCSGYLFVRFVAATRPNSTYVIDFLLEAFREMGVPLMLYTDNDRAIVNKWTARAASILDRAFAESGGFKMRQHLPHNAKATGKVEVAHKYVEKYEKLFSIYDRPLTMDEVHKLAVGLSKRKNRIVHRATNEKPVIRFNATFRVMRVPPPALLDSAFKATEYFCQINPDLTVSFGGTRYQLPRRAEHPFRHWHGRKVTVVHPTGADYFVLVGPDGDEYEITMKEATPDRAGEHKTMPESVAQQTMKRLRADDAEHRRARKAAGAELRKPLIDTEADTSADPVFFPRQRDELTAERVAEIAPGAVAPSFGASRLLTFVEAVELLQREEVFTVPVTPADKAWLKVIFRGRECVAESELLAEAETHRPTVLELKRA